MNIQSLKRRFRSVWWLRRLLPGQLKHRIRDLLRLLGEAGESHVPSPMEPGTRSLLEVRFGAQLDRLSELTGLDFEDWNIRQS